MTGLALQELSMLCLPITAHLLRLVGWEFSLATEHSTITQRKFWRRITRSHFKKRWHSPSTISSSRIPHTMRIVDRYRFSRAGYMRSSSAFPDTCSAGFITRLASGTLVLLASLSIPVKGQAHPGSFQRTRSLYHAWNDAVGHRRFALSSASGCRIEAAGKSAIGSPRTLKSAPHKSASDLKRQLASSSPLISLGTMSCLSIGGDDATMGLHQGCGGVSSRMVDYHGGRATARYARHWIHERAIS